jgi:site-specific recombinase XerD
MRAGADIMTEETLQSFPVLLQKFFTERLIQQRHASPCTVAAYRDAFRLLLAFAADKLHKHPIDMKISDFGAPMILSFLAYLEEKRHNCIRSRNARFAAIRSFMEYVAFKEPSVLALTNSVLAIPMKRCEQRMIGFLSREQTEAILNAPDINSWTGQRDRVMFAMLYNTGARISELLGMRVGDVVFGPTAWVHIHGKGRKERSVPLWKNTARDLKRWLRTRSRASDRPLFPGRSGSSLTRTGFTDRLKRAVVRASKQYPELAKQSIFPHLLRHSVAMHMLQSGVDITVIALWLGHESPATTHRYVEADLEMKERALKAVRPPSQRPVRYRPKEDVLGFLQSL